MMELTESVKSVNMNRGTNFQDAAIVIIETVTEAVLPKFVSHIEYCKTDNRAAGYYFSVYLFFPLESLLHLMLTDILHMNYPKSTLEVQLARQYFTVHYFPSTGTNLCVNKGLTTESTLSNARNQYKPFTRKK